jgi:hypothetical protein
MKHALLNKNDRAVKLEKESIRRLMIPGIINRLMDSGSLGQSSRLRIS